MSMEGINWEGVISEAKQVANYSGVFSDNIYRLSIDYLDDLTTIWGTGNAVMYANSVVNTIKEIATSVITRSDVLIAQIIMAAQIYSEKLQVSIGISKSDCVLPTLIDHNLRNDVNGVTGLNRVAVSEKTDKYKKDITKACSDYVEKMNSIQLSIFDAAGVQREAFDNAVNGIVTDVQEKMDAFANEVDSTVGGEIEKLQKAISESVNQLMN